MRRVISTTIACALVLAACGGKNRPAGDADAEADAPVDPVVEADDEPAVDAEQEPDAVVDAAADVEEEEASLDPRFVVVTFNTGTTAGLAHDSDGDAYGSDEAAISDAHYGDGLAWAEAVQAVTEWFALVRPDVVAFQEIFYSGECETIASEFHAGFVCETWSPGDPTVAQVLLGEGYQVACHPGKNDKCIGVKKSFGTIRQCDDPDFCLEGLDGERIEDCGGGARVARATIDLVRGGTLTVVNVHGTSGIMPEDMSCREQQVEQVFVDMDGEPGASGTRNVVMGDLNIDPGRVPGWLDPSSAAWNEYVGGSQPFQWISPFGSSATPTYTGGLNIDHVASDAFTGGCIVPGVTAGYPPVWPYVLFDHKPLLCEIGSL